MSAQHATREHLTTATVNGCPVVIHQAHRAAGQWYEPNLVTVSAPVALSVEDVAAMLFSWMTLGGPFADLDNDAQVREFIADYVVNEGCLGLEDIVCQARQARLTGDLGTDALLAYCQHRASTVFAPATSVGVAR